MGGRKGGREGGKEGGREEGREGGREGWRGGTKSLHHNYKQVRPMDSANMLCMPQLCKAPIADCRELA